MTQRQRVFGGAGAKGSCKVLFPPQGGRGRHLLEKVTRRDDLSGLLVAVLDLKPTDKRTRQSDFSTRGLGSAHALSASGRKVVNHLSPLPVACGHAAPPSCSPCGTSDRRQPLFNGGDIELARIRQARGGCDGSVRGGAQSIFLWKN